MSRAPLPYSPCFFVIRSPLLPMAAADWSALVAAPEAPDAELAAAVAQDSARLSAAFLALVADPRVREALLVASPDLAHGLAIWEQDPAHPHARNVPGTLYRYLSRMATRCTPFGLFAGCSTGTLGPRTDLTLTGALHRHTRLDMQYLAGLCEALEPTLRPVLTYRANTSLVPAADQYRYAEGRVDPNTRARRNDQVTLQRTPAIDAVLATAPAPRAALVARVLELHPEVSEEDAQGFVDGLIDAQILVSDLSPPVTGEDPLGALVDQLAPLLPEVSQGLAAASAALRALDAQGLGHAPERYEAITAALGALPAAPDPRRLYHVDLYKPAPLTLGPGALALAEEALRAVVELAPPGGRNAGLDALIQGFDQRWGGGEVPLIEVLDDERGLGFNSEGTSAEPSPLLAGLAFPSDPSPPRVPFGPRERWMLRRLMQIPPGAEWVLDAADRAALSNPNPPSFPDAFALMGTFAAADAAALDRGEATLVVTGLSGPSGASLLGRFCLGDAALRGLVQEHLRAEEAMRPDAIYAEIVHLPEGRMGNVLGRPRMRAYEIPYLGRGAAPEDHQIPVTDLLFRVSNGRVVLRSRRLGREVVPRLTSAHNHVQADLPIYRFLGALPHQGQAGLGWSWGPLAQAPRLPRVRLGRVVLAVATWNLAPEDLKPLVEAKDPAARVRAARELRARCHLPRQVASVVADNVLPLDLECAYALDALVGLARGGAAVQVEEIYPGPDQLCVEDSAGRYTHEVVIPYVRTSPPPALPALPPSTPRAHLPGSEWAYVKIYTGTLTADAVLSEVVAPLVAAAREEGTLRRWFFIRYGDPEHHLRVRFQGAPQDNQGLIQRLAEALRPWHDDGRLWRVDVDTYQPEIDRYGGEAGLALSEAVFEADSDAVAAIVALLSGDEGADARWRLALRSVHLLAEDLGLSHAERLAHLGALRQSYAQRFHLTRDFEGPLSAKYRAERASLEAMIAPGWDPEHPLAPGFEILSRRSAALAPVAEALRAAPLNQPLGRIFESYVHMTNNRMLRSQQNQQEMVIYDFLIRLYRSAAARGKG